VVVAAIVLVGLAWAAGALPGLGLGATGRGATRAVVAITGTRTAGMRGIYPGGTGDVSVSIANHSSVTIMVTAVDLPANTTYAAGYTTSARTTPRPGCSAATSDVAWNGSTTARGSVHRLVTPLVIGAHRTAVVTLAEGARMSASAPAACEGAYFAMPALTGVGARVEARAKISTPHVDTWIRRTP
jgi:hypothetical protein